MKPITCRQCGGDTADCVGHRPQPYMSPRELERTMLLLAEDNEPPTHREVATRLGVTPRALQYWLAGQRTIPKLAADELERWAADRAERAARGE